MLTVLVVLAALGACGDRSPSVADDAGVPNCNGCVGALVVWNMDGGMVAYTESSSVTPCRQYTHSRDPVGGAGPSLVCTQELEDCGAADLDVGELEAVLANHDVLAALNESPVLYGNDTRPVDGAVLQIRVGDKLIEVGADCPDGGAGCVPIPAGVNALATLLRDLDTQELARGNCAGVF